MHQPFDLERSNLPW